MSKKFKACALVLVAGTMLQFGGCIGKLLPSVITAAALEFVWDNDGILDLFEDGATAADAG